MRVADLHKPRRVDAVAKPQCDGVLTRDADGRPTYNGITATARTQAHWPAMRWAYYDKQRSPIWLLACSKPGCPGELTLRLHKTTGHTQCETCRHRVVDGHTSPYIDRHPEITRVEERPDGHLYHYVACAVAGCKGYFAHKLYVKKGRRQCEGCDYGHVKCEGYPVRNPILRAQIARLCNPKVLADKTVLFEMRCETQGCANTFAAASHVSMGAEKCLVCAGAARRLRPYEVPYRYLLTARAKQIGKPTTLTYAQMVRLCRLAHCFYCQGPLRRGQYSTEPNGVAPLLDRLASDGAYAWGNVVPCCGRCNRVKGGTLSGHDMLAAVALRMGDAALLQALVKQLPFTWAFIRQRCGQAPQARPHVPLWQPKNLGAT